MRISVIFHRLGPYHVARLNALAARCELTAIELTDADKTYAWDKVSQGCAFRRLTLLKNLDTDPAARRELPAVLRRTLDQEAPDAVAAPGWGFPEALAALDWCLDRRVPAVLMSDSQASDHPRRAASEFLKGRVVRLYSGALVGGKTSVDYVAALGMEAARAYPGYDVVDNRHFREGADRARAQAGEERRRLGLPERFWLASNRFVPEKNLPTLLKAYARYRAGAKTGAFDLVLLGDGPLKRELLELRGSLGLESAAHFPGFAQYPDLPSYYGLASAFVHASTGEPWGLVINEAMAAGLPVLASRACGCVPDLLKEGSNGFTFDPRDEADLLRAMRALGGLGDLELTAMGAAGRAAIEDWSPELFAANMLRAAEAAQGAPRAGFRPASRLILKALIHLV